MSWQLHIESKSREHEPEREGGHIIKIKTRIGRDAIEFCVVNTYNREYTSLGK